MNSNIKFIYMRRVITLFVLVCFFVTNINVSFLRAQEFRLPAPGVMLQLSPAASPALLKGIKLDTKNPFRFHFFVDRGDSKLSVETPFMASHTSPFMASQFKKESEKLIKYFLASLAIPEKDLWVTY